jgi:hypothetical protein
MGEAQQQVPFRYTFATWVYQLHTAGIEPRDTAVKEALAAVDAAEDAATGEAAGEALVAAVDAVLGGEASGEAATAAAASLYGEAARTDLGQGDRASRTARIRRHQFSTSLAWLARVYERDLAGVVAPTWHLVRQVTDEVDIMDPNPWNDVDERRAMPLSDFHVLWELAGCDAVSVG